MEGAAGEPAHLSLLAVERLQRRFSDLQLDAEGAAPAGLAGGREGAVHGLDQAFGQGQAQPGAFDARGFGAEAIERDEQACHPFAGEAVARVANVDPQPPRTGLVPSDEDLTSESVVLDGVAQEVEQDLLEALAVGLDVEPAAVLDVDPDRALQGHGLDQGHGVGHQVGDAHRFWRRGQLTRRHAGDVQHVVDEVEQVACRLRRCGRRIALIGVGAVVCSSWAKPDHGVQRGAQLVAHAGQEVVLGPVRGLRDAACLLQLLGDALGLGHVPGDLGEPGETAVLVEASRDHHIGPEAGAVFADPPAELLVGAGTGGFGQLHLGLARLDVLARVERREVPADDLLGSVALDPLGAQVPARDVAVGIETEDGVVAHRPDEVLELRLRAIGIRHQEASLARDATPAIRRTPPEGIDGDQSSWIAAKSRLVLRYHFMPETGCLHRPFIRPLLVTAMRPGSRVRPIHAAAVVASK